MRRLVPLALVVAACGSPSGDPDAAGPVDAPRPDGAAADAAMADAAMADAATADARLVDAAAPLDGGTYRSSLGVCWTDPGCPRALAVAHGGAWDALTTPYLSNAAIAAAYAGGIDGVKIDVRITMDGVPVLAHSSPVEFYESLDCAGRTIETMTAAQVTACHRLPSSTETFQRLDAVLDYLRGKLVAQLTVKRAVDYAGVIAAVHAAHAEDFAFFEIDPGDIATLPSLPGAGTVWFVVNAASSLPVVDQVINAANPRIFMVEFDPTLAIGDVVATRLHPHGVRGFTYDDSTTATVAQLAAHYGRGLDVVSSQTTPNVVMARQQVNTARGVSPP